MTIITEALYVVAEQVGINWQFQAIVFVEDPPGGGTWRKATAGEVEVELKFLGEWWQLGNVLETLMTDVKGNVSFAGSWQSGAYTIKARHLVSGSEYRKRIDCHDDGTYDVTVE